MRDIVVTYLAESARNKLKQYKSRKEWEKLFVDTGEFFINEYDRADGFINDLAVVMSEENMKVLAAAVDHTHGVHFKEKLEEKLQELMRRYEMPLEIATSYTKHFLGVILNDLERNRPEAYQGTYLAEWRAQNEIEWRDVRERIEVLQTSVDRLKPKTEILSLIEIEKNLLKETSSPKIDLGFFMVDDEEFQERFRDHINDDNIYVKGKCKEETIYCILNELRRLKCSRPIMVVKNSDEWEKLHKINPVGCILIPWFYGERILSISNNTNIFVFGEDEHCVGKNPIVMRKRTRSTMMNALVSAGMRQEEASKLVTATHGLYMPLKKKIINGAIYQEPKWAAPDIRNIAIPALLIGEWEDREGDKLVVSQLFGKDYEDVIEELQPYMMGEEPLIISYKTYGERRYKLACIENAWDYLGKWIRNDSEIWKKFSDLLFEILIEVDPIFDAPIREHSILRMIPKNRAFWSKTIKEGMLRTLIMRAFYFEDKEFQNMIDVYVSHIVERIDDKKKWAYISEYFTWLMEASPEVVMKRLEDEWKASTGLMDLFSVDSEDYLYGNHYYYSILWGVEQLLVQKEYAMRAANWLIKLDDQNKLGSDHRNDSIGDAIEQVLCPWINVSALSASDKVNISEFIIQRDKKGWDRLYNVMPGNGRSTVWGVSTPRYRPSEDITDVSIKEFAETNEAYFNACLSSMDYSTERWIKMIKISNKVKAENRIRLFDRLLVELSAMDDDESMVLKNEIRKKISNSRYFADAEWRIGEDVISEYEALLKQITAKNPVYEYLYLFLPGRHDMLLHPVPYNAKDSEEKNKELKRIEIEKAIKDFKQKKQSVVELIRAAAKSKIIVLGHYLYSYFDDSRFNEDTCRLLFKYDISGKMGLDYVGQAYNESKKIELLRDAIQLAKELNVSSGILAELYGISGVLEGEGGGLPLIAEANRDVKKEFWKERCFRSANKSFVDWQIRECIEHGSGYNLIQILWQAKELLSHEEVLKWLLEAIRLPIRSENDLTVYYFKKLLKPLQDEYIGTDKQDFVIKLEMIVFAMGGMGDANWTEMKCLKDSLERSPKYYADMIGIIFADDDGQTISREEIPEDNKRFVFSVYNGTHFCPANRDGNVDKDNLQRWIDEYKELLTSQNQERLIYRMLGRVLAYSPKGADGFYPCEAVREVIESLNDESLINEYEISIFNERGVYTPSDGREEKELAGFYKQNADGIRSKYPVTATIYDRLCKNYEYHSRLEREQAEYAEY